MTLNYRYDCSIHLYFIAVIKCGRFGSPTSKMILITLYFCCFLGVPIISHKDLMHKALNVPPTPSPDSAIHSAYSVFSSPNQSPLTQRHITLTPNLSRNNSDASHSSCCSYSSVSVSVSPTQQFSPTHSPIQVSVTIGKT